MQKFLTPGDRIEGQTALQSEDGRIYQDTANDTTYYRAIDGEVVGVYGSQEQAQESEQTYQDFVKKYHL
jgi:hypothetical protein